jgi:predicted phage baseplate assembly protein
MSLPVPNLDDRRFQDLVDDAKRLVQERCPEWTDHNVHDPGVTLIELFAWLTDQILYRLNRVPDLNYVKFLELIGVTLYPPNAARCELTFKLSVPNQTDVGGEAADVPAGTQVSSRRGGLEPVVFTTEEKLYIVPSDVRHVASMHSDDHVHPHDDDVARKIGFRAFGEKPGVKPEVGEAFLIGLARAVPSCFIRLELDCVHSEAIGVDPDDPPLGWQAWDGSDWAECEVELDTTGGLNRQGEVQLHVPRSHKLSTVGGDVGGWLRCVVQEARPGQPQYDRSPEILKVTATTLGGSVSAIHAEVVTGETLGLSDGRPGQRFRLQRTPVVFGREPPVLEVVTEDGVTEWTLAPSFADSDKNSQHFMLDAVGGEVVLGPAVREPDGALRHFGAVPPRDSLLRMRSYLTGGGPRGNVQRWSVTHLHTPWDYISSVQNRRPATGGVDAEDIENAKVRGPLLLRTGDRAVTAEDYRALAMEVGRGFARVECVQADRDSSSADVLALLDSASLPSADTAALLAEARQEVESMAEFAGVRVLVVPAVQPRNGRIRFEDLTPDESQVRQVALHLDERRVIGVRIAVGPPMYQGVTVIARIRRELETDRERLRVEALEALYRYLSPLEGGASGDGWPFGRAVHNGDVTAVLQAVHGVHEVEEVLLFTADPVRGRREGPFAKIDLPSHALTFPYEHRVLVVP